MPRSEVIGTAVLRDYPLRLWEEQQEHTAEMLREFQLMLSGQESGQTTSSPPAQLLQFAASFTGRYGALLDEISVSRQQARQQGLDRMDSEVPLLAGTAEILEHVRGVLDAVDAYCRHGDLLMLARTPVQVALQQWTNRELVAQLHGAAPTPWPGPF